jgi:hypothetical protein
VHRDGGNRGVMSEEFSRTSGNLFRIGKLDQANSAASENEAVKYVFESIEN